MGESGIYGYENRFADSELSNDVDGSIEIIENCDEKSTLFEFQ